MERENVISDCRTKISVWKKWSKSITVNCNNSSLLKEKLYENSIKGSFFAFMKREELYRWKFKSENELYKSVEAYMIFYNDKRPHASNGYKTPTVKEELYFKNVS